jgi:3-dehydroquinate dehydratase-2
MDQILDRIRLEYPLDRLDYFQTNHEGELIQKIQEWVPVLSTTSDLDLPDFVLLNAGGWTHTSVALADAVAMLRIPVFEVHLSHPPSRESFRGTSPLSVYCKGTVSGFGPESYRIAYAGARSRCLR